MVDLLSASTWEPLHTPTQHYRGTLGKEIVRQTARLYTQEMSTKKRKADVSQNTSPH